jgi:hypothetical protein
MSPAAPLAASSLPALPTSVSLESTRPARLPEAAPLADPGQWRGKLCLDELFQFTGPPGYYSEPSRVALLRRARRRPYDQLLVDFSGPEVLTELTAAGRVLWTSRWDWQATVSGQPLVAAGPWQEVCWHTDSDVDYLEIEQPLTGGWNLQRQAILARKDRFLLLADALLGPRGGPLAPREDIPLANHGQYAHTADAPEIRYAATIQLAGKVQFSAAAESREGWLMAGRKRCATIVPLALPEWRAERGHAELAGGRDGSLVLMQAAQGRALYAPLWIDLDPRRVKEPLTWRRLTVAENLQVVPRDVAVGYRVQAGKGHWLAYRTLAPRGNRTVLGQNYSADFVCARLLAGGTTDGIIEIQ